MEEKSEDSLLNCSMHKLDRLIRVYLNERCTEIFGRVHQAILLLVDCLFCEIDGYRSLDLVPL